MLATPSAFEAPDLFATLFKARHTPQSYDTYPFGVVGMDVTGKVFAFNAQEAKFAGLLAHHVLGRDFFTDVAPCTNNYFVSGQYAENDVLDEQIDYTFSVKMKPTRVRLRMLKNAAEGCQFLLVKWE